MREINSSPKKQSDMSTNTEQALQAFHVMAKPTGAQCNLECDYCFFLKKDQLYPDSDFRMSEETMESYIRQTIEGHHVPEVTIAWQGGEPTLMGLDFFRRSIEFQQKHKKTGTAIQNSLQTNGTLLDDEWCAFFQEHNFLIGISIDGPRALHNAYRVDKGGKPTFDRVMRGFELLTKHNVDFNILCTVHAANSDQPLEIYRFFRDELGTEFIQFIPIVGRTSPTSSAATPISAGAEQYGRFLASVFDEWLYNDVGQVFVQIFDVALGIWTLGQASLCIFAETCGRALALEHNGDLFSCDHFVTPDHRLGNLMVVSLVKMVESPKQRRFGQAKRDSLPAYCQACDIRFACNGGCPKNRFALTPEGEPGLNYLCAGYQHFFHHIAPVMQRTAVALRAGKPAASVVPQLKAGKGFLSTDACGVREQDERSSTSW